MGAINSRKPWGEDDDSDLISLFDKGLSDKEIAEETGRSVTAIQQRRFKLELERKSGRKKIVTKEKEKLIIKYAKEGKTGEEIGGKVGISRATAHRYMRTEPRIIKRKKQNKVKDVNSLL